MNIDFAHYVSEMELDMKMNPIYYVIALHYNNLRENVFEMLNHKIQFNISSVSHEIQTFTILNPDSSKRHKTLNTLFIFLHLSKINVSMYVFLDYFKKVLLLLE